MQVIDHLQILQISLLLILSFSRLLELNEVERESLLSNHRFLIQSKVLNEDVFTRIQKLPLNSRTEEVS
jgi:hypothetical protein